MTFDSKAPESIHPLLFKSHFETRNADLKTFGESWQSHLELAKDLERNGEIQKLSGIWCLIEIKSNTKEELINNLKSIPTT